MSPAKTASMEWSYISKVSNMKEQTVDGCIFYGVRSHDPEAESPLEMQRFTDKRKDLIKLSWLSHNKELGLFLCAICQKQEIVVYDDNYKWQARSFMISHKRCKTNQFIKAVMEKNK